jgi:CHAD domain-containing protein
MQDEKTETLPESQTGEEQKQGQSSKDSPVAMRPDQPLAEAGRVALFKQLEKLRKNEDKAREGEDPEGVHDMRVATRRLRAGLTIMEETVYEPEETEYFRRKLRGLAQALGAVRDSDVLLEHLDQYRAALPGEKLVGLETLRETLEKRREDARKKMIKVLDRKKTAQLLDDLDEFLTTPGEGVRPGPDDKYEAGPTLVRHFSGSTILRRYEEVLAYETRLPEAKHEVLHRLRVACKHLRYTLEFFEEALPSETQKLIEQLIMVQDHLGRLQDHYVAIELIDDLERDDPENEALKDYAAARTAEAEKLVQEFQTLWPTISGPEYRKKLLTVLVG